MRLGERVLNYDLTKIPPPPTLVWDLLTRNVGGRRGQFAAVAATRKKQLQGLKKNIGIINN